MKANKYSAIEEQINSIEADNAKLTALIKDTERKTERLVKFNETYQNLAKNHARLDDESAEMSVLA